MAVIPHFIRYTSSGYRSSAYHVPIASISVGTILGLMFLSFCISLAYFYHKANKQHKTTGKPIPHGKIILKSLACATLLGVLFVCCFGGSDNSSDQPAQQGATQGGGGAAFYPTAPSQPQYTPQMNWDPVNAAAESKVQ
ncbi:uncharacterized protein JN550_009914 [Neoarthrinium moseri]|uniref:uncharacterized protein n=1 Tax=Neoarthrinium moseri TaxID=1658444 RepID=UPI001FDCA08C|nr:uncharacterized protein JN550_009914 [Neoarthrinium moseri]KAI1862767.1 hypothetical protein JN550_009914 [Neoarthrinium moseri]